MQRKKSWLINLSGLLGIGFGVGWLLGLSVSPVVSIVITSITSIVAALIAAIIGIRENSLESKGSNHAHPPEPSGNINPWPLTALIIGIFLGSIAGVLVRTHDSLGAGITSEVQRWANAGLSEKEITRRLFELEHPYTPYAEDLKWMSIDASSGITTSLASEVKLWTDLGLKKEDVVRRLFEIKYPFHETLPISTSTKTKSGDDSFSPLKTSLYLTPENRNKCGDLLRHPFGEIRAQIQTSEIDLFQKLSSIISDNEQLYKVLDILCNAT